MAIAKWYPRKLQGKLDRLLELRETAPKESLDKIDENIAVIHNLLSEQEPECDVDITTCLDREYEVLKNCAPVWPGVEPRVAKKEISCAEKYCSIPKLSDDEVVGLVHDFCRDSLDRELFKRIRGILKKKHEYINMRNLGGANISAESFYLPYFSQVYILLRRYKDISDLVYLSHELGHSLQFKTNYSTAMFFQLSPFLEVVSQFFELLSLDYFRQFREFEAAASQFNKVTFDDVRVWSKFFWTETEVLELWDGSNRQADKSTLELLSRTYAESVGLSQFSVDDIYYLLSMRLSGKFKYFASYVCAVELLMLYKKDRDRALDFLKRFMQIDLNFSLVDYYTAMLDLGLTPGENLSAYRDYIMRPKG